jgi:hypothetical protein
MTAVTQIEQAIYNLKLQLRTGKLSFADYLKEELNVIHKAKIIEKAQIIDSGNYCADKCFNFYYELENLSKDEILELLDKENLSFGEEYYNKKFNNK